MTAPFSRRALACTLALHAMIAVAADPGRGEADPELPSLEDLLNADVTTAGRRSQKLAETAAAAFVITREDMRRSGVLHLADALRMVPGMQAGRISGDAWAVSARGFVGFSANKLLVMIDGRSVYDPLFSGVQWNVHDLPIDEIERIEVIRGPGASLWGANAVNGVVNIITRSSADTRGGAATATAGAPGIAQLGVRHGGLLEGGGTWRVFAQAGSEKPMAADPARGFAEVTWRSERIGGRLDMPLDGGELLVTADLQASRAVEPSPVGELHSSLDSGHVMARRSWRGADGSLTTVQGSLDRLTNDQPAFRIARDTLQLDLQQQRSPRTGHTLVWGAGLKVSRDDMTRQTLIHLTPQGETQRHAHFFVQDDIALSEHLSLTLGSKFEHNHYDRWQVLPTARLAWQVQPQQTLWAAISRAARTPSRAERGMTINPLMAVLPAGSPLLGGMAVPPPFIGVATDVRANADFRSEHMRTIELGYRAQLTPTLSGDFALYRSRYDDLRYGIFGAPIGVLPTLAGNLLVLPVTMANGPAAVAHGVEAVLEWRPAGWWRLQGVYSQQHVRVKTGDPIAIDTPESGAASALPRHQLSLRSGFDLPHQTKLDLWLRHVSKMPMIGAPAYTVLDARVAWRIRHDLDLALVAQNLGQPKHPEALTEFFSTQARELRRGVFLQARYWF